ncbi:hypothetical protein P7M03_09075 [Vibrio parahaemolyticus]|nr:hypothetical protein [Vibrio parahaemolyticus]MDG2650554.1 hypothetical protein [Vibrio parahaemolyticus]HCE2183326.1 hypothetical protein [Vibrio parahaemolyticus]
MAVLIKVVKQRPDDYLWERAKRLGVTQHVFIMRLSVQKLAIKMLKHPKVDKMKEECFLQGINEY